MEVVMHTRSGTRLYPYPALYVVLWCFALATLQGACSRKVTVEDSPEGKIAVYSLKVVEGVKAVADAVKQAEASGLIPTDTAAKAVEASRQVNIRADELGALLQVYDTFTPQTSPAEVQSQLDAIRAKLTEISTLAQALLVPVSQPELAAQIAQLTGAVNQTLIAIAVELAKGVQ